MTIARDRLKLSDFTPLREESDCILGLDQHRCRFAIDDAGSIVKIWGGRNFTDQLVPFAHGLKKLRYFTALNHPAAAEGISNSGLLDLLSHPSLFDVIYQGNLQLTGRFFSGINASTSVKRFAVPYCPIDDAGLSLARDCSLTHISLRGSQVSDVSVDTLCSMRSLVQIHVKQTHVSRSGLDRLRVALPGCWIDALDRPDDG